MQPNGAVKGGDSQGGMSLRAAMTVAALAAGIVATALALATFHDLWRAANYLARAERSYEQLSLVTRVEADVNALLLDESARAVLPEWTVLSDVAAPTIERTLARYLASIGQETELLTESLDEKRQSQEVLRAIELRDLFRAVQGDLGFMRNQLADSPQARDGRNFAARRIADGVVELRRRTADIVKHESDEVAAVNAEMEGLRGRFAVHACAALLFFLAGGLAATRLVDKGLARPLSALAGGARRLAEGDRAVQVAPAGLRELRELGRQFNVMAGRIVQQQSQLETANERLEATVRARTRELQAKTEQLADIDRNRRLFFAKVSHELRTPATVLLGEASLALRHRAPDVVILREALTHIRANGEAMRRRLEDMLMLAQSDEGRLVLRRAPFDLAGAAREAVNLAGAFAASSGVVLKSDGLAAAAPMEGDESWLRQALLALIDNAVKFSPHDGQVRVELAQGDELRLSVLDEGPGAPDEALGRLFDPYYQCEGGSLRGGSGLGLAVARWIAEQHGGGVAAINRPEGGLQVSLILPRKAA
ncbi:hypothetical protein CCR94_21320 [Rhodoblastus sphagnicola]|uniref:histidine kinase n=1 Tax=Rhodoblastus sphagnicola TaxID=333368 RepID=A0A2S6MX80_9HYPH|nr:HAMP domain-containing sensor histidine kinase [Rhodoblastus sphagnicola]MBB4199298.1 signal transduction histidine kinase [Rhodoblastus sphagnicola]PPQ26966.1 hypothetical protein CCR94_21320 [Rhodoblastus sphagnicola]